MWVKLYTKLLNWEWYSDINIKVLFIHCLLKANYKDKEWQGTIIKRGSFVTSREKLSEETSLTVQQIRTALKKLKSTNEITIDTTNKYTIISIVNYEMYQQNNQENNQQITNNQPTNNQQITTTSEYIEYTEYKNNIYYFLEENFGRTITQVEMRKLDEWKKWFNDDVIKYAIEITLMRGARSLSYTEGIINSWHDKGYKTLEQCKNENKHKEHKISEAKIKELEELADYDWLND